MCVKDLKNTRKKYIINNTGTSKPFILRGVKYGVYPHPWTSINHGPAKQELLKYFDYYNKGCSATINNPGQPIMVQLQKN